MHQRKSDSWKSTVALMAVRPHLSRLAYVDCFARLLAPLLTSVMLLLLIITDVMIGVELVLHPLKAVLVFLQYQGWTFLSVIVLTLALSFVVYLETRQGIKYMKGLVALTQADPTRPSSIHLAEYLETSGPLWIQYSHPVELPDDAFDVLREHVRPEEPWLKSLAAYFDEQVITSAPPVSILVCLRERITVSILGPGGKRRHIPISQEQTAGVIGWLALCGKGAWVRRREVIQPIYGEDDENVTKHISRLNDSLNKAVQKVLPQTTNAAGDQLADQGESRLKLIDYAEDAEDRRENRWRLSVVCDVESFPEVLSLYDQVIQEEKHADCTILDSDTLHSACHRMMGQYGKGLFAKYQHGQTFSYWSWARDAYIGYQDKCLHVLEYAAKREGKNVAERKDKPDVRYASIRRVAQYYAWMADVALGMIPNRAYAERAIYHCLALYRIIRDLSSARAIYQTYANYMMERDADWKPSEKIINAWSEATSLS